ncbi:hypothetical protein L6452_17635 [Arctium lappa]|uniref:Uncharacterized protein n=1 Tax=Arctium lappa TaxID=4217 RepID=A0ACB9C447_ARCLA|nr:hypothetical protein L6452_17635 [Arctium lappa]
MVHGRRWFTVKSRSGCSRSPMVHRSQCPIDGSQICEEDGGRLPRRRPWLQKVFFTLFFSSDLVASMAVHGRRFGPSSLAIWWLPSFSGDLNLSCIHLSVVS